MRFTVASRIHLLGERKASFNFHWSLWATARGTVGMVIGKISLISEGLLVIPTLIDGDCNQEIPVALCFISICMVEPVT